MFGSRSISNLICVCAIRDYVHASVIGIQCQPPPVWQNIATNTTSAYVGTVVGYWCNTNYTFDDGFVNKTTNCSAQGTWTPDFAHCLGK